GQCKLLTDTNFDEMTYVHLLKILKSSAKLTIVSLKRLIPNGFEKVYYCKNDAKLSSIREIKSDQDIADMLKVGYDNGNQIDMYVDHFSYDIMEMVEFDRNEELRKNRIKAELECSDDDYDYSDDDLEQIDNVDFHTEGDDSVVIKNISTQDPFLTKLCSSRVLFKGNVDSGVDQETPQVDPDDNQIDSVYKEDVKGKKAVKKAVKKDDKKKPVTQSGEGTRSIHFRSIHLYQNINVYNLGSLVTYKTMQALLDSNPGSTCTLDAVESDNGSGLIDAVNDWLPEAEHIKSSCTLEQQFQQIIDQIKLLDAIAYHYLIQRNLNSWSRAFFEMDRRCAAFENGISESFNKAIIAFSLEDIITPSIRKRLELLKEKQREWIVFPSGFQELEVRKGDQSYGVNLQYKVSCKADPQPKPEVEKKPPGRKKHVFMGQCASRGDGRSGRVNGNDGSGTSVNDGINSGVNDGSGRGVNDGSGSGRRGGGRAGGRGKGVVEGLAEVVGEVAEVVEGLA
ncbi:hypothetical protein Tco_0986365, partial [Tanacetum coccineum]